MEAIANVLTAVTVVAVLAIFLTATPLQAQYASSYQTNIISGVTSNWVDNFSNPTAGFVVGSNLVDDALLIDSGGVLSNGNGCVGYGNGDNDSVVVSDNASVWNNAGTLIVGNQADFNTLTVMNGGIVDSASGSVGANGSGNAVWVTGGGSVWNSGTLVVGTGFGGGGNSLTIARGGAVYSSGAKIDFNTDGNDKVVVTDPGSVWQVGGDLGIGNIGGGGSGLVISNGGAVYDKSVFLDADNGDSALVTDTGSVWSVSGSLTVGVDVFDNSVTVANGAALSTIGGSVEGLAGCSVLVSDPGSVWHNTGDLSMGYTYGLGSSVVISNGAAVYNVNAFVGVVGYGSDFVSVNGPGSLWCNSGNLSIGLSRADNQVAVADGGTVLASNVYVYGGGQNSYGNQITVCGGTLYVTNALGNGALELLGGSFALNGGTVTVDSLMVTNGSLYGAVSNNIVSFTGGTLNTKATTVSDGFLFTVGDGTHAATLTLASGGSGFHSFANGLSISSNAMLDGAGTIIGATTINAGGVLSPGDGPGSITFSNSITLAAGSTFAVSLNGTGPGQYDQIIGLGPISIGNSILSVSLGYKPSPGDSFTIVSNLTSTAILGTFVTTDGVALPNGADFVADGTTFQLDYAANADGMDVTLMALVPEPSTCFLVAIGLSVVFRLRRRRRQA